MIKSVLLYYAVFHSIMFCCSTSSEHIYRCPWPQTKLVAPTSYSLSLGASGIELIMGKFVITFDWFKYFTIYFKYTKVPNVNKVEDLRPISLLPIPGKILEKHIYSILTDHLENNKLFSKMQNGFRKNHGTTDKSLNSLSILLII